MIDPAHALPLTQQARVLGLSRASIYYTPRAIPAADLQLMRRLEVLHLEYPFAGSRMLRDLLRGEGTAVGRDHVRTLMRRMGLTAISRRPQTSARHPAHPIFPYLLRGLVIDRPNQVWATDITYIPMATGFVFLCAIMDWASRRPICGSCAGWMSCTWSIPSPAVACCVICCAGKARWLAAITCAR